MRRRRSDAPPALPSTRLCGPATPARSLAKRGTRPRARIAGERLAAPLATLTAGRRLAVTRRRAPGPPARVPCKRLDATPRLTVVQEGTGHEALANRLGGRCGRAPAGRMRRRSRAERPIRRPRHAGRAGRRQPHRAAPGHPRSGPAGPPRPPPSRLRSRPGDVERVRPTGLPACVERQLDPSRSRTSWSSVVSGPSDPAHDHGRAVPRASPALSRGEHAAAGGAAPRRARAGRRGADVGPDGGRGGVPTRVAAAQAEPSCA